MWEDNFGKFWLQIVRKPEMPFSSSERIESLWLFDILRRDCCLTSCTGAVYPSLWNCKVIRRISEGRCQINFENTERATHSGRGECRHELRRGANAIFGSFRVCYSWNKKYPGIFAMCEWTTQSVQNPNNKAVWRARDSINIIKWIFDIPSWQHSSPLWIGPSNQRSHSFPHNIRPAGISGHFHLHCDHT
jgi:hypothetical protein